MGPLATPPFAPYIARLPLTAHVTPNQVHTLEKEVQLVLLVHWYPLVATNRSMSGVRSDCPHTAGCAAAFAMHVPDHDGAVAGNRTVTAVGSEPYSGLDDRFSVVVVTLGSNASDDGTLPYRLLPCSDSNLIHRQFGGYREGSTREGRGK